MATTTQTNNNIADLSITTTHAASTTHNIHRRADRHGAGNMILKIARIKENGKAILDGFLADLGILAESQYILGKFKHIRIIDGATLALAEEKAAAAALAATKAMTMTSTATVAATATTEVKAQTQSQSGWQPNWKPNKYTVTEANEATATVSDGNRANRWDLDF